MRMPDPEAVYPDGEVVWSESFDNEGVGVWVATNLLDGGEPDRIPIRIRVTTEDGTGSAYLTADEAYELVQLLGNAITKAKNVEREQGGAADV
jgi:hypothetical protein